MYLIDTNVVSEIRKGQRAAPAVVSWFQLQRQETLFLSVITILEVEQGYQKLLRHDVRQAQIIRNWIDSGLLKGFQDRILSVDTKIVRQCAGLHIPNKKPYADAMIAATALSYDLTIITRNTRDFEQTGARLLNPWQWRT
jgi:toxin FitB